MKLILGRAARDNEHLVSGEQTPALVRATMRAFLDADEDDMVVCTFSPTAVNAFERDYRNVFKGDSGWYAEMLALVFVFDGTRDRPVTDYADAAWMEHFSLGDLYANGTFDAVPT